MELTGALGALVAVGLAVGRAPFLALVLALCGVLAAGAAVRPERRPVAGYLAAVLFVAATWVRLAASEVSVPEAYTLPVTVPALVVGVLRRRKDPGASSWTAYGPGLAATLLPSLAVAWTDPDWLRPLLLGVAALVITLLGRSTGCRRCCCSAVRCWPWTPCTSWRRTSSRWPVHCRAGCRRRWPGCCCWPWAPRTSSGCARHAG
ncbi:hypothetical protein Smic_11550 [Streptomyces microflavus]|uniref:Uncharacterized protein n=1 Tax=Streptomyces microflavus TaxID=1919 RepID=A0A7J0CJK0_STRMI|nr:hypothetical protein Smic_11550 [Streptomyces microflavus]